MRRALLAALFAVTSITAPVSAADLDCSFDADLASAEIGQPIACTLVVRHPAGTRANVDLEAVLPSDAWILLEPPAALTLSVPDAGADAARVTTVDYVVAALEPGELELIAPAVMCEVDGEPRTCGALSATITVAGALGPDEDAPRPPARAPIPDATQESAYVSPLWFLLVPVVALAILLAVLRARRPRPVAAASLPTARERIEGVDMYAPAAEVCAALRDALRTAHDDRAGLERAGLTDDEWVAALDPGSGERERFTAFFARCEAVRFGGDTPTRFALDALREEALALAPVAAPDETEAAA